MSKKVAARWAGLAVSFGLIVGAIILSTYNNIVFATNLSDIDTARNNTAVKILARNLSDCWKNAQSNVNFSSNNSWKYGSSVYWINTGMQVYYPKILAGKTGNESSSTCADMITGWKTNWLVKLFTDRGDFVGVDQNVAIPGDWDNEEVFWDDMGAMKTYLTGTGYKKESASNTALSGYQCLYFHLGVYRNIFRDTKNKVIGGLYPAPANAYNAAGQLVGPFDFISRETYCVPLKDDGEHIDFSKELKVYLEEDDLGNGLDREGSSMNKLSLDYAYRNDFKVDKYDKDYNFVVTIHEIYGYYQLYDSVTGEKRWADDVQDNYLKVANNKTNSKCFNRFEYKSWFLGSYYPYCSVSANVASKDAINLTYDQFKNRFAEYLRGITVTDLLDEGEYTLFSSVTPKSLYPDKATAKFTKGTESDFVKYFFDTSGDKIVADGYALDTAEQYMFYYDHLKDYFGKNITTYLFDNAGDAADAVKVVWINETTKEFETKYLSMGADKSKKACALDSSKAWDGQCATQHDWVYFAEKLGDFTEEELAAVFKEIKPLDEDYSEEAAIVSGEGTETPPEAKSCTNAAQSLGWILCPVLDVVSSAAQTVYNDMLKPALEVKPTLFVQESGADTEGTKKGWEFFRDVANVLFVIFLLVVIFSQLTGYGIDNYGIKKILPKLIVVAVMVNLSYFICTALVDLSNILGNALQQLFMNLPGGPSTMTEWTTPEVLQSSAATLTVTALVGAIAAGAVWAMWASSGGAMILVGLLLGAISILISFLFLFILLAARQMAIVILVVISPLAIICYALPNTKSLFDKYKKLGQSLLLVYPIAGALVGGGDYVSRLMLSNGAGGDFAMALTAMLAGIVPIFFIPSVLKGSLNMMGQLGSKISGFGKNMGAKYTGNLDKGIKSTDRYKNYQDMRARDRKLNEANRNIRRLNGRSDLTDRQRKLLAQSMNTVASERETDALRNNLINGGFDARMAGADAKADAQRVADIESMISNGRMDVDGQAVEAGAATAINSNNMNRGANSLAAFHRAALARHANATTTEERSNALAQIRAVQNMMSKTDAGRAAVMSNLSDAVARAQNASETNTSRMAAAHLMSDFGDLYKSKNRGAHSMISDLSTDGQLADIQTKIHDGVYDAYGVDKYTEETLAGADDAALDNLISAMNPLVDANGNTIRGASLTGTQLQTLQNTAYQALEKSKAGTLNIKPEVVAKLEQIRNGYVPQSATQAQSAQQQAQNTQDNILQELQDINAELRNQNRNNNGGNNP